MWARMGSWISSVPSRESACECERRVDLSLPQALNLVNGRTISDAVADPKGRVAKLILGGKNDAAIEIGRASCRERV